jgi:plasmid stabilization system protein ParE
MVTTRAARFGSVAFGLETKNPDVAARAIKAIRQGVRLLRMHPEIGRPAGEMPPEFREWPIDFGNSFYIAWYRYDGRDVVILSVRHAKEAWQ